MTSATQRQGDFPDAFAAAFIRLQAVIERACLITKIGEPEPGWPAQTAAAICAVFEWAAANPSAADLLTNEALARGRDGIADYHRLIAYLAERLHRGRGVRPENSRLPEITERATAGGLASLVAQRLDRGCANELPTLAPEAIQFALTPYVGAAEARRIAARPVS